MENAIRDILGYLKVLANTQKEQAEEIGKIILKLEKSLPSSGSSPLTIEEARKLLEEYKKEIQGFPLKYLKEGQKKNNLESLLRAYFLNSKHNENIAIAAGYLSTVAREELRDSILSEEWDKKQIKIAEIVAALTAKTSEQEIVSPLTLEDARARLDKTVADYKAIITSSIEEVEANATKSAKLLLLQKLTPYKKFVENTEKMNKGSLFRISISAVDMIRAAKDKYIPETDAAIEYYRDKEEALKILQGCKEAMKKLVRELGNLEQDISASLYSEKEQEAGSLPLTQEEAKKSGASSALKQEVGGIDFTWISYLTQPMGSFQGLDLRLPLLSKAELEGIDISRELAAMEQMVNARIDVSTDRLKCLLAAMSQKDAFTAQRETQLLPLILRLCWLKEERGVETTPDFRAVLLIADTGLFVAQGKRSIL